MTDKDLIFKNLGPQDLAVASPASYSYIGWEGNGTMAFYLFAEDYHKSAQTLYEKMVSAGRRNEILDGLIYPMIFSHRHFCELMLKGIYFEFSGETEENLKKFLNRCGHDLMRIWQEVKPLLSRGKKHVGSKVNLGAVEHYLQELNSQDPDSMAMRYPITKNLDKMRDGSRHLDFHHLHDRMNELHDALNQIKYDIANQMTINHIETDIDSFKEAVYTHLPKFRELLSILKPLSDEEADKGFEIRNLFSEDLEVDFELPKRPDLDFIFNNGDDFLILVETLYYSGRHVEERLVTLSKNPDERIKEFICLCLDEMQHNDFRFGQVPKDNNINIHSKGSSAIHTHLLHAFSLLGIMP